MKAVSRWSIAMVAAGLALAPASARAQNAQDATRGTPAADSVGPRELQNFSLNGTVTRQAEPPPPARASATTASSQAGAASRTPDTRRASDRPAKTAATAPSPSSSEQTSRPLTLPPASTSAASLPAAVPEPGFSTEPQPAAVALASDRKLALWPWLLLAAVLGAGAAFLFWRRRSREALVDGLAIDALAAPEPSPIPRPAPPAPAPPKADPPKPVGVVSTRLRPWLELAFAPLSCRVDEDRVTVEFELQLLNSGGAPARDILVEASMFNAGPTQEQDIGAFFARPVGEGERIETLPPLQRVTIGTALVAPRANIQQFELGGRKVFVPLVAFNAIYRWSGGGGQTSLAYLLGRETKGDKLGPLRLDLGTRAFTALGTRPMPNGVRN